jgi:acetyl esterase/lipase
MSFTLDPEVAEALAPFTPPAGSTPPPAGDVAARRAMLEGIFRYADTAHPHPDDVTITDHELAAADGATIPLRWYARKDAPGEPGEPGPAALYLHGGGMIAGRAGMFDGYVSRYVSASGTPILSAGYRLAPEHPHPVPVEDAYAALAWLHEHAASWAPTRPASASWATAPAAAWPPRCRSLPATATARPSPGRSSSCRCSMTAP